MTTKSDSSSYALVVAGIDWKQTGTTYGAHLHTGPCVAGDGLAAGSHYNITTVNGQYPPTVNNQTEVWLDFKVGLFGIAGSGTTVPFAPTPGTRSIVIHAMPTAPDGTAGARLACLPVVW